MNATHPQVGAYLDDLARMLSDVDPGERDDILASVREHLDTEIGERDGTDAVVHAALLRLGPPERVAAVARAGQPGRPTTVQVPYPLPTPPAPHPVRTRTAGLVSVVPLGLLALSALLGRLDEALRGSDSWAASTALIPHPSEIMFLLVLGFPIWLVAVVVAVVGRELTTQTKAHLASLGPATTVAVIASAFFLDPLVVSTPLTVLALGAVTAWAAVTARRVWRETRT